MRFVVVREPFGYSVVDSQTHRVVYTTADRDRAWREADRRNKEEKGVTS